ncbi:MAG: hypothetical protein ABJC10_03190 [Acidobacteriota bacterium]
MDVAIPIAIEAADVVFAISVNITVPIGQWVAVFIVSLGIANFDIARVTIRVVVGAVVAAADGRDVIITICVPLYYAVGHAGTSGLITKVSLAASGFRGY